MRNMGSLALDDFSTLGLVRACVTDATRPVMVATEAVRTLAAARLPPKFARLLQVDVHSIYLRNHLNFHACLLGLNY